MAEQRGKSRLGGSRLAWCATAVLALAILSWACRRSGGEALVASPPNTLRLGISQVSTTNPAIGLRQLANILTVESLARAAEDGRMQPSLAESWTPERGGRSLSIKLRPNVTFPDGTPVDAEAIANILPESLKSFMGPIASDVEGIRASGVDRVELTFKHSSPFLLETLENPIQRPGTPPSGTGPYVGAPGSMTSFKANASYYLGKPAIENIDVTTYPTVRAAWAELLRDRIDMLWEVDPDALDSMTSSNSISVFTYTRRYQYVLAFNPSARAVESKEVRRALNTAINRDAVVKHALNGHGLASSGPFWPQYWALANDRPKLPIDPRAAAETLRRKTGGSSKADARIHFTCLIPPDSLNERVALEVKRQLEAVGVDMALEEIPQEQLIERLGKGDYETMLFPFVSGPTLFRPYLVWHSGGGFNWGHFGGPNIDKALDAVRFSESDTNYRAAVASLNQIFAEDPPAVFLAWQERARAVSRRFSVPSEPGRDILGTLRLWKPAADTRQASRN
jgi:peptide/nickel transport system substrate-binding protein